MSEQWTEWDVTDCIESNEDAAEFINAVLELNDPDIVPAALGAVARARGMAQSAECAGVGRESLYKSLSRDGNPRFSTVARVIDGFGLELRVAPKQAATR